MEAYVAGVKGLAKYYMRPPDQLSDAEVQRYLLHLHEERHLSGSGNSWGTMRRFGRFVSGHTIQNWRSARSTDMKSGQGLPNTYKASGCQEDAAVASRGRGGSRGKQTRRPR